MALKVASFRLYIVEVDMNGFCGRTYHPEPSDAGLTVIPLKMDSFHSAADGRETNLISPVDDRLFADGLNLLKFRDHYDEVTNEAVRRIFTCVTEDGRLLELMDHEVDFAPAEDEL